VVRSRLGDCGVMRNLPVDPSAVNPKTLVQLKKIRRGKTRGRADQDGFRSRGPGAALRGNFRVGDRSGHRIFVLRAAYFPQAAHRKCRKSSRQFLAFDRRSSVLRFSTVFVLAIVVLAIALATVCRNRERPRRAFAPAGRADARASRCNFWTAFVMETRIFRDAPELQQFAGAGELACPYESSTELAGG
jgi:hypothetical protein